MKNTITICGGGAIGHVLAGVFGSRNDTVVNILSNHAEAWRGSVEITDPQGKIFHGILNSQTANPSIAIPNSDIVILCVPGYLIRETLSQIKPFLNKNTFIGACVASSGFFFIAEDVLDNDAKLFGFQRVPYIARVQEYGKSASLLGYKPSLNLGTRNIEDPEVLTANLSKYLQTPVHPLSSYYDAALTNSNPILHPSRLYGMWHDWKPGIYYPEHTKFYEDWDNFSAETLIACDEEFFKVIRHYPCTPGAIPRLLDYYESKNASELTAKLKSIAAFKGIKAPMLATEKGFLPDWKNRYFTEDIPFGMQIIKDLALKANESVPTIDKILAWYQKVK